jgi:hypothetical protein
MTPTIYETTQHEPAQNDLDQESDLEDFPGNLLPDEECKSRVSDEESEELIEDSDPLMDEDELELEETTVVTDEEILSTKPAAHVASLDSDTRLPLLISWKPID